MTSGPRTAEMPQSVAVLTESSTSNSVESVISPRAQTSFVAVESKWDRMSRAVGPGAFPGIWSPLKSLIWLVRVDAGIAFLIGLLAVLAAVPGLSLLALGFMLAAQAEVARTGRLRHAFPLLPVSTRTGTILLIVGVFLLPIWLTSYLAAAHGVIAQSSPTAPNSQRTALVVLQVLIFVHLAAAIGCGGTFGCFLRPIRNIRRLVRGVRDGSWQREVNLWSEWLMKVFRPLEHLIIAIKATVGAVVWLFVPTAMLALSTHPHENPAGPAIISFTGGILLIPVASWLPLLQVHQAVTGRFRDIFAVRIVRTIIKRVPFHWALATILLYAVAIPLYFTKIRLIDAGALWLLTPLFIVLIYPTRIMFGWVYARGQHRPAPAARLIRFPTALIMVPVLAAYAGILFFTPLISEAGHAAIFENHAFLLPIPGRLFGP